MKTIRILFIVILMTACSAGLSYAQTSQPQQLQQQKPAKEKIMKEDLPMAAIKALESDDYKGWAIVQVYRSKVKDAQGKETSDYEYEAELKMGEQLKIVKFDKDGNAKRT